MDSINRNHPEQNRQDLPSREAIGKIKELVKRSPSCFFRTVSPTGASGGSRPMSVQQVDDGGTLWFLSASDSHKNAELAVDPAV